jgi:hypothetical protein
LVGRVHRPRPPHPREHRHPSKAKAAAYERKRRAEVHEQVVLGRGPEWTFGEATAHYFDTIIATKPRKKDGSPSTAALYETGRLRKLEEHFGCGTPISRVASPAALSQFNRDLLRTRKANTANRYLNLLRAVLNRAHDAGGLATKPIVKANKCRDHREWFLSEDEEARLVAACPDHLRDLVVFMLDTGARSRRRSRSPGIRSSWTDSPARW